ncbi:hypothetical protein BBC0178_016730 [Bartonella apihabitans]|uniref:Uncharacterized protein n=1 Tax=Bartonella apihabitans TaxID=2750929 RepID=A0A1U9MCX3_9HYPH|nr:hypothetical protein BBC0178_016730 [Bartonella apihabitans]
MMGEEEKQAGKLIITRHSRLQNENRIKIEAENMKPVDLPHNDTKIT